MLVQAPLWNRHTCRLNLSDNATPWPTHTYSVANGFRKTVACIGSGLLKAHKWLSCCWKWILRWRSETQLLSIRKKRKPSTLHRLCRQRKNFLLSIDEICLTWYFLHWERLLLCITHKSINWKVLGEEGWLVSFALNARLLKYFTLYVWLIQSVLRAVAECGKQKCVVGVLRYSTPTV
jgi:hypothetical protein